MDYHLSTLSNTLSTIRSLQEQLLNNGSPQPFTNAFLSSQQPDSFNKAVDQFIRDTSPLEKRLFHFPPVGGIFDEAGKDGQHAASGKRDVEEEAADIAAEIVPRKPEVRNVSIPTPLRSTTATSGGRGASSRSGLGATGGAGGASSEALMAQYDARALLVAAQRLNENYQRLPRNRKHIRILLKKHNESAGQVEGNNVQAAKIEEVLTRIANGEDVSSLEELPALLSNGSEGGEKLKAEEEKRKRQLRKLKELREKAQRIKDELNREEMEVLALEEMREELLQQKRALAGQRATASGSGSTAGSASTAARKLAGGAPQAARGIPRPANAATTAGSKQTSTAARNSEAVAKVFSTGAKERGSISPAEEMKRKKVTPTATPPRPASTKKPAGIASSSSPAASSPLAARDTEDDVTVRLKPEEIAAAKSAAAANASPRARTEGPGTPRRGGAAATATSASAGTPTRSTPTRATPQKKTSRDPEATDELERLTEKIWDAFGEHLRFFNPSLEAADFSTTLGLLRKSIAASSSNTAPSGSSDPSAARKDDASSVTSSDAPSSSSAGSSATLTGSAGGQGGSVAAPTLQSRFSSLILLQLLLSPPPEHSIDFPALKLKGKEWFDGLEQADKAAGPEGAGAVGETEDGEGLTTKAVYALVAKRLLRVRRAAGKARIGFS